MNPQGKIAYFTKEKTKLLPIKSGFDNCLLNTLLHFPFQKPRESLPLIDFLIYVTYRILHFDDAQPLSLPLQPKELLRSKQ